MPFAAKVCLMKLICPSVSFNGNDVDGPDTALFRGEIPDYAPWRPASTKL
jgi:hypothetical protein